MASTVEGGEDRLGKYDLCMLMAIWMEMSPNAQPPDDPVPSSEEKAACVGVIALDGNLVHSKIFAAACSSKYSHGVNALALKYGQRLDGSTLFVSRKPCSECTKHMIQVGVKTVYYFPTKPEVKKEDDLAIVDHTMKVSHLAMKVLIPEVIRVKSQPPPYEATNDKEETKIAQKELEERFGDKPDALSDIQVPDDDTIEQRHQEFKEVLTWLAVKTRGDLPSAYIVQNPPPEMLKENEQELLRHAASLTYILAHRTTDPSTGVGAVLMNKKGDYLGFGYNGYQINASLADFSRYRGENEKDKQKVKYPYIVHAEANALLFRNEPEFDPNDTVLFSSKSPCNHCTFHIRHLGIKHVVAPESSQLPPAASGAIGYGKFDEYCKADAISKYMFTDSRKCNDNYAQGDEEKQQ
ncbi:cytidine and dCMP deaminase domain-containing protein 1-like [Saccoglossus kowalevskii]|uniref:Cytidine and dCMP deaminase domain-containing protein 1 n=1 Tax=Saccoglossus kowalevskii TaxID=10224 RepID=A0ABM0MWK8_SACKO|nr:PREDICTED: cytidine and dCMP deaminase domain-containing protein 1-like [Saccoglossus kowalevskii]